MSDINKRSIDLHKELRGKIEINPKQIIHSQEELSQVYSPGVAAVCEGLVDESLDSRDVTAKGNTVAVVTDGSAVLGLGNIGPTAALPVMEGKAMLFKQLGGVNAVPICLDTENADATIAAVGALAPTFGGINLEDIAAPDCFKIEDALQDLGIPVFHDDQHATAIVAYAGLINALQITGKKKPLKIVISGAGAAGVAIAKLLAKAPGEYALPIDSIVVCDSRGIISSDRDNLTPVKKELLTYTNLSNISGTIADALLEADVFIGVSIGNLVSDDMVRSMNANPIIFALANPTPEIDPDLARQAGAAVVATGRSDYPNQINNILAFPGIFKGLLEMGANRVTDEMKYRVARALAEYVENPNADKIIPEPLDIEVPNIVARALQDIPV